MLRVEYLNILTSVDNLALVLRSQRKYKAVEEIHRRALKGREKVLGVEHPDTLTSGLRGTPKAHQTPKLGSRESIKIA